MKTRKLLLTIGTSFAMAAALVSCGFTQKGESGYESEIKTVDLSSFEASYWNKTKATDFSGGYKEYVVDKAGDRVSADKLENGELYTIKNSKGEALNPITVNGLKSVTYTYYKRSTTNWNYVTQPSAETYFAGSGTTTAPTEAGSYWVIATFKVDTDRYLNIDPWYAQVDIHIKSPYTAADFVWEDLDESYDATVTHYSSATLHGVQLTAGDTTAQNITTLIGIDSYKYTYEYNNAEILPTQIINTGTYTAKLELTAKDNYQLPVLQSGVKAGSANQKIKISTVSGYSVSYSSSLDVEGIPSKATGKYSIGEADLPTLSSKGYIFGGWYTDADFTNKAVTGDLTGNVTLYAKWDETEYHKFVREAGEDLIVSGDFDEAVNVPAVPDNDNWLTSTKGLYYRYSYATYGDPKVSYTEADLTAADVNEIKVEDGVLKLVNDSTKRGIQLCMNFGTSATSGTVEGMFDIIAPSSNGTNKITAVQVFGKKATSTNGVDRYENTSEFFGIRTESSKWTYRIDGGSAVTTSQAVSAAAGTTTHFSFVIDIDNKTLTVKANGATFVELTNFDVTEVSAIRIASGDGNKDTWHVDNLAVKAHVEVVEETLETYKPKALAALEEAWESYDKSQYTTNLTELMNIYMSAKTTINEAESIEAARTALDNAVAALAEVEKDVATSFAVTYSTAHGTAPEATEGSELTADMLAAITADGYYFKGWYTDSAYTTAAAAGTKLVAATTLYAKWEATAYTAVSTSAGVIYANTFADGTIDKLCDYLGTPVYGKQGLYQFVNPNSTASNRPDYSVATNVNSVEIADGVAKLNDTTKNGTQLVYDFGGTLSSGKLEIAVDLVLSSAFTAAQQPIQFIGTNETITTLGDFYGIRNVFASNVNTFKVRENGPEPKNNNGGVGVVKDGLVSGVNTTGTYSFYFLFDMDTHTVTVKLNGETFFVSENMVNTISYMKIATGDGGTDQFAVDNFAVAYTSGAKYTKTDDIETLEPGLYSQVQDTKNETPGDTNTKVTVTLDAETENCYTKRVGNKIVITDTDGDSTAKDGDTTFAYYVLDAADVKTTGKVTYSTDIAISAFGSKWTFVSLYDSNGNDVIGIRTSANKKIAYTLDGGTNEKEIGTTALANGAHTIKVEITIDYDNDTCDVSVIVDGAAALTDTLTEFEASDVKIFRFMTGAQAADRSYTATVPTVAEVTAAE